MDRFVIAFIETSQDSLTKQIDSLILAEIEKPMTIDELRFDIKFSVGVFLEKGNKLNIESMLNYIDLAMLESKKTRVNKVSYFEGDLEARALEMTAISNAIRETLDAGHLHLNFMPIFDSKAEEIVGAEVLIRTSNQLLSRAGPDRYIPIAENMGLIYEIDQQVLNMAFEYRALIEKNFDKSDLKLAVNISSMQLRNPNFPTMLSNLVEKHQICSS